MNETNTNNVNLIINLSDEAFTVESSVGGKLVLKRRPPTEEEQDCARKERVEQSKVINCMSEVIRKLNALLDIQKGKDNAK